MILQRVATRDKNKLARALYCRSIYLRRIIIALFFLINFNRIRLFLKAFNHIILTTSFNTTGTYFFLGRRIIRSST